MKLFITMCLFTFVTGQNLSDINSLSTPNINDLKALEKKIDLEEEFENKELYSEDLSDVNIISEDESQTIDSKFFGYDYFERDISFFDNLPTPSNYLLGPGDEIFISMWGENNSRENYLINKDGMIFYENIGFISLSNLTLTEAKNVLVEKLSNVFSTLQSTDNPTDLSVELGKLKSINIYITGQVNNPGINLIHPFSNIFTALVQSGGIKSQGSLRQIKHIRNGEIIQNIDFYQLFINGVYSFKQENLIDGDIIHVPVIKTRVDIEGEVKLPLSFELLPNEQLSDLVNFAGGFSSNASNYITIDQVIPITERLSEDNAKSSINVSFSQSKSTKLNNGDKVIVLPIKDVQSKVEIYGKIKNPGKYAAQGMSLKNILDIAGGFDDPIFRKTIQDDIVILRKDENQFYSNEIIINYNDADSFPLKVDDKIFVYENINYRNSFTYRVEGEVNKPGTYPLKRGITVGQAIDLSGGLTELSTFENIVVSQEFTNIDEDGNEVSIIENVANVTLDFELSQNSIIKVIPFENVVSVKGNVYNPGLVAFEKGITMTDAIIQAGGYKPYSLKKSSYVKRANGEIDKAQIFGGRTKRLMPGDTVFVPVNPDPSDFDLTTFVADLSTTLANIAAILLIVDNQND